MKSLEYLFTCWLLWLARYNSLKYLLESRVSMNYLKKTFALALGALGIGFFSQPGLSSNVQAQAAPGLADGPGVWINMWNYPNCPEEYCLKLHASGIRNIFVQTSRSNTEAICHPGDLSNLLETAHRFKMRVIAWSFAELREPNRDAEKLIDAAQFRSPKGERLDAIASNLEKDLSYPKVEAYSLKLRQSLGNSYPIIAVVYSPLNHAPQVANIPWKLLDKYYNVIAPMNYWNSKYEHIEPFDYTLKTIKTIRALVGRPDVEVHVIGDGMGTHGDSIKQFMAACHTGAATSASLYPNQKITEEQLSCLSQYPDYFPYNSRFRLASYRELIKSGTLVVSSGIDPADPIQRGEFYRLALLQMNPQAVRLGGQQDGQTPYGLTNISPLEALSLLDHAGIVKGVSDLSAANRSIFLTESITSKEALETTAAMLEAEEHWRNDLSQKNKGRQSRLLTRISHNAGGFFVQPAHAADENASLAAKAGLTYLDAAEILLTAANALK